MKPPEDWPTPPPIDAAVRAALEHRQQLHQDITSTMGIPPELLHDAPDNPRRVYRGFDLARDLDFSAWMVFGPAVSAGVLAEIRRASDGFAQIGRALAAANVKVYEADRAFRIIWWHMLTKAQQRRHGKRLIREEIARRRIARANSEA